ncbi:MAG: thiamine phosphate synthase [Verrucomicrobia bacterium]|nr:MAG: thiamine phosphate synthase [Verrucomicrobiota bacterium]
MKPLSDCHLYAFVDTAYLHGRAPEDIAQQLCDGEADLIQLRAKQSSLEEIRRMAAALHQITQQANVGLVINDHPSIAQEVGADFCHLGQEDFFKVGQASRLPPSAKTAWEGETPGLRFGLSSHSPEQARRAKEAGAAYLGVGPVYATATKPQAKPVTLEYVRWAAANVTPPWFAIGGITLQNLDEVLAAGARRVCVVSAILNSQNVVSTCRAFKERLRAR